MYNGIGLTTPRGSGTNGYVQRNLSSVRVKRPRDERGGERDEKDRERLESQLNRQPNAEILEHQRKRQLEVKCAELQDMMEEQGWGIVFTSGIHWGRQNGHFIIKACNYKYISEFIDLLQRWRLVPPTLVGGTKAVCFYQVMHQVVSKHELAPVKEQLGCRSSICAVWNTLSDWTVRYSAEEIDEKVNSFRMMLQEKQEPAPASAERPT